MGRQMRFPPRHAVADMSRMTGRLCLVAVAVLALIALGIAAPLLWTWAPLLPAAAWISTLTDWIAALGAWGVVAFALFYAVTTVLLIPGSVRTITAGMLFGVGLGALAAWSGAVLGASLAFLLGRYFARSRIEGLTENSRKFQAIDRAICTQGWKIIGLMRLSPVIPFNLSNYFYGITSIGFWPYVLASAGGMLPGSLFYAYLGAAGKAGLGIAELRDHPVHFAFFGIGLLATLGLMIWVAALARHSLRQSGAMQRDSRAAGDDVCVQTNPKEQAQ